MVEERGDPNRLRDPGTLGDGNGSPHLNLLAQMSHEMRTPLSAILGFAQLMESATPSPTASQKKRLDLILQAGWRLESLIDMARDLALIESGTLSLSLNPVSLPAVMLDCQAKIGPLAHLRGVRVSFPRFDAPCFVSADRIRLQQVLETLLSAAIEFGAVPGAMVVYCEMRGSESVRVGITGAGDRSSAWAGRFPDLVAGRQRHATDVAGTDIGLRVAAHLIELMGGTIGPPCIIGSTQVLSFDLKRIPIHLDALLDTLDISFITTDTSAVNAIARPTT